MIKGFHKLGRYLPNACQSASMLLMALALPWLIGINEYGFFSAYSTIPLIIVSYFEAYLLVNLDSERKSLLVLRYKLNASIAFTITVAVLSAVLFSIIYKSELLLAVVNALVICYMLSCKTFLVVSLQKRLKTKATNIFVASELGGFTLAVPFVVILVLLKDGRLLPVMLATVAPILLVSLLTLGSMLALRYYIGSAATASALLHEVQTPQSSSTNDTKSLAVHHRKKYRLHSEFLKPILKSGGFKAYEDLSLTILPAVLFLCYGGSAAGICRIAISLVKASSKVFPHRYDLFAIRFSRGGGVPQVFFRDTQKFFLRYYITLLIVLLAALSSVGNVTYYELLASRFTNPDIAGLYFPIALVSCAPFIATTLVVAPSLCTRSKNTLILTLICFSAFYAILFACNSLLSAFSYISATLILWTASYSALHKLNAKEYP